MPALPWFKVSTVEPGTGLIVMASRLPLRHHRHIPGFLRWTLRIRHQLSQAPGLVGYSLDAHVVRKTFWTLSAWTSQEAMDAFVGADPHRSGMAAVRPHMGRPAFVFWTATPEDLPLRWSEARARMDQRVRLAPGA